MRIFFDKCCKQNSHKKLHFLHTVVKSILFATKIVNTIKHKRYIVKQSVYFIAKILIRVAGQLEPSTDGWEVLRWKLVASQVKNRQRTNYRSSNYRSSLPEPFSICFKMIYLTIVQLSKVLRPPCHKAVKCHGICLFDDESRLHQHTGTVTAISDKIIW